MGDASFVQASFLGGEWSQTFQGRVDRPDYRTGMNLCLNGIPIEAGTWVRRPGFMYAAHTYKGLPGKLLRFEFEASTPYTVELTANTIRFYQDQQLVFTNDAATVAAISTANPAVVQTSAAHGFSSNDQGMFAGLGTLSPLLHNRQFIITVTDSTHFSLADALTGAAIDGSTLGWSTPSTLPTFSRILAIATPYAGSAWANVRMVQAENKSVTQGVTVVPQAILLHPIVAPQVLEVTREPIAGANYAEFAFEAINFVDGPYLDPTPNGTQVIPSATTGIVGLTLSFPAYVSTATYDIGDYVTSSSHYYKSLITANLGNTPVSSPTAWAEVAATDAVGPNGFQGSDIGRHIRLFSEPASWVSGTSYPTGSLVKYNGAYYECILGTSTITPGTDITRWIPISGSAYAGWTWGKITSLLNQISQSVSGVSNLGDMTGSGGLAAAFDNITADPEPATKSISGAIPLTFEGYIGRHFGGGAQKILSVTCYPGDYGWVYGTLANSGSGQSPFPVGLSVQLELRAKATAPTFGADGTLLGTSTVVSGVSAIVIQSSDAVTAWNYVWVRVKQVTANPNPSTYPQVTATINMGELQYFGPPTTAANGVNVQILGPDLLYSNPIFTWRLGLFSPTTGYPTVGTFHEGRLWLAGVVSNRIDSSNAGSNNLFNFAPTAPDGTVGDANAISYTFNVPDVNPIYWMEPDQQGILCGTKAGEWLVQATAANLPLTPLTTQAHRVTKVGCANAEAARCEHAMAFIHRSQRKLMEYFPDVYSGKFTAPNLTEKSKHLTKTFLQEITYQQELTPIIWGRRGDGQLIGWSYKRENLVSAQGPTFVGAHQHVHGAGHSVISMRAGVSSDGTTDTLSIIGQDPSSFLCYVQFMSPLLDEDAAITDAMYLDNMIAPYVYQNITMGGNSVMQCTGLWHLNGKTVTVFAGGLDLGDYPVTNGQLTVPYSPTVANGNFTASFVSAFAGAMPVLIGFTYTSRGQILRAIAPQESGARNGPALGKIRRSNYYSTLMVGTRGISFGTSFDSGKMIAAKLTTAWGSGAALGATALYSGVWREPLTDQYGFDSMLGWEITRPYPANIAAASCFPQTQDI